MTFIAVLLIVIGSILMIRNGIKKARMNYVEAKREKSEGEILKNPYILDHERKMEDDKIYDEYLDWCKFHGELPSDRKGFDEFRLREWRYRQRINEAMK